MTDIAAIDDLPEDDRFAAEYILGLLDPEDSLAVRGRIANDADFAAHVALWEDRLAPLLNEAVPVQPGPELWDRIRATIDKGNGASGEVISLQRKLRTWRWVSAGSAAAAVAALSLFVLSPGQTGPDALDTPQTAIAQAPLMANVPIGDTDLRVAVTYLPEREEMLVSANGLTADGVHDHELWLVVPGEDAISMGIIVPGEQRRVAMNRKLVTRISAGSQLVLTREPLGGAPVGGTAGPVVAEGQFTAT